MDEYFEYFCGSSNELDNTEKLKETSQQRFMYYKITSALVRAYASLANDMHEAGYSKEETIKIKSKVKDYEGIKKSIKIRSGEFIDLKRFEPDMRQLIDNYIDAEDSKKVSVFEDLTLVELIVESGISTVINNLPQQMRKNNGTVAETIDANVRKVITKEKQVDPIWYQKMSTLLDEIILDRRKGALDYEAYLKRISELCKKLKDQFSDSAYPNGINSKPRMTLYNNLNNNEELAIKLDETIIKNKPDGWKGDRIKERMVEIAIEEALNQENIHDAELVKKILKLAIEQKEY
jgi:type I restriction enzyme R subunit